MAGEPDGHTLDATALVHEAYLRLGERSFASRSDFVRAAAEAMRRILVDHARSKRAAKRGGGLVRTAPDEIATDPPAVDLIALDEALSELERYDPTAAELVKLRHFAGLSHSDAAELLGLTRRRADGLWAVARAWLYRRLSAE
jgi:RNA polymerase sigma factor (TIGR02999 family)